MPLTLELREAILSYCDAHLPDDDVISAMFDFLDDTKLKARIEAEFYAARYVYKLGEALAVGEERLHAHVKFQIVQYAGIYEAIIIHLLWGLYADHPAVTDIEFHAVYKKAVSLPSDITLTFGEADEELALCVLARQRTSRVSIKFDDKVDAAVEIGFVDQLLGEEIKGFYKLRNAIHLESAVKNDIKYELDNSLLAFRRMQPFTVGIREFLRTGALPPEARLQRQVAVTAEGDAEN